MGYLLPKYLFNQFYITGLCIFCVFNCEEKLLDGTAV